MNELDVAQEKWCRGVFQVIKHFNILRQGLRNTKKLSIPRNYISYCVGMDFLFRDGI